MDTMKCDMSGAAAVASAIYAIALAKLPVHVVALVPATDNRPDGNAYVPGDIITMMDGTTVEVLNTDAEGRLILGDALTRASEEQPELIIDFATLTGAARVALGPELPALFARQDETADALLAAGRQHDDEVWRLPLYEPYAEWLKSDIADINNTNFNGFAGATVAALFLDRFVAAGIDWVHFDTWAWRQAAKPGRPKGGEALGLRAAWHMLYARYG